MGPLLTKQQVPREHFGFHPTSNLRQNSGKSKKPHKTDLPVIEDSEIDAIINEIFKLRSNDLLKTRENRHQRKAKLPNSAEISHLQSTSSSAVNIEAPSYLKNEKTNQSTSRKNYQYSMGNKLMESKLINVGREKVNQLSKRSRKSNKTKKYRERNSIRKSYQTAGVRSMKHKRSIEYSSESSGVTDDNTMYDYVDTETGIRQHFRQISREPEILKKHAIQEDPQKVALKEEVNVGYEMGNEMDNSKFYEEKDYYDYDDFEDEEEEGGEEYEYEDFGVEEEGGEEYGYEDFGVEEEGGEEYEYEDFGVEEEYDEQQGGNEADWQWIYADDKNDYYDSDYERRQNLEEGNNPYFSYAANPVDQYQFDSTGNMMLTDTIYQTNREFSNVDFHNYQNYPETYEETEERRYLSEKQFDTDIYNYYSPTEQAFAIMAQQKFSYNNNALSGNEIANSLRMLNNSCIDSDAQPEANTEMAVSLDKFCKQIRKSILLDERAIDPIISCFNERVRLKFGHDFIKSLKEYDNCSLFSCSPFFKDRYGKLAKAYNSILRRSISEVEQLESMELLFHSMKHGRTHWVDLAALVQSEDTFRSFFCKQIAVERYREVIQKKKDFKNETKDVTIWRRVRQNSTRKIPRNLKEIIDKL